MCSDRLSALPVEIVSCILSLMPTKYAVRTSILSKRWRYSWMFVTNLDFDDNDPVRPLSRNFDSSKFLQFVDRVLEFCKSSQVKLFRLNLFRSSVPQSRVSKWIDEAVRLNVGELDIQLTPLDLPLSVLTCKTLTKLRICYANLDCSLLEDPCSVNLPCLKTLDIVASSDPSVNVFKLIRGSPILEFLSLEVKWCEDEEEFIFNIPTLKQLKLTITCSPTSFSKKCVLNVPNLEYLFVGGDRCWFFVMEDVSSLVEASVSFNDLTFDHWWFELLEGLTGVVSFQVKNTSILPFMSAITSHSSWPIFSNLKHLELKGFQAYALIPLFLESSPQLEHLCIEKVDYLIFKPGESSWIELKSVPACMLTNLTTIKFSEFNGEKCDMEFLEYILGNAKVLKTVTITWENLCIERVRLCAQLLAVSRASRYCEIHFPSTYS